MQWTGFGYAKSVILALVVLIAGCSGAGEPGSPGDVVIDLQVSPAPGMVAIRADVTNRGPESVYFWAGCGCGVWLQILDPGGEPLDLYCGPDPLCPCGEFPLAPGESASASLEFRGSACMGGREQILPQGTYGVRASFSFTREPLPSPGEGSVVETGDSFRWERPGLLGSSS